MPRDPFDPFWTDPKTGQKMPQGLLPVVDLFGDTLSVKIITDPSQFVACPWMRSFHGAEKFE